MNNVIEFFRSFVMLTLLAHGGYHGCLGSGLLPEAGEPMRSVASKFEGVDISMVGWQQGVYIRSIPLEHMAVMKEFLSFDHGVDVALNVCKEDWDNSAQAFCKICVTGGTHAYGFIEWKLALSSIGSTQYFPAMLAVTSHRVHSPSSIRSTCWRYCDHFPTYDLNRAMQA